MNNLYRYFTKEPKDLVIDERQLVALIRSLCQEVTIPGLGNAVRCGTPVANQIVSKLKALASILATELELDNKTAYRVKATAGYGNLPRVLWIAILKRGQAVSNATAVVLCFGKHGNGMVLGVMEPLGFNKFPLKTRLKNDTDDDFIDVSSRGSKAVKYNNRFFEFTDLPIRNFDCKSFLSHAKNYLALLKDIDRS